LEPHFFLFIRARACHNQDKLLTDTKKWACQIAPFLEPMEITSVAGDHFCSRSETFFFPLSMADVALWLGPYMSISSKTSFVQGPKRSENAGKSQQTNNNTKLPDDCSRSETSFNGLGRPPQTQIETQN